MAEAKRKLAAILSADVAGYSRLMGADEEATLAALNASRTIFRDGIEGHGGRVVDTAGDSVLAEFPSVVEAVRAAVAIQHALADRNGGLPEDRRMLFRIGVNLGDVIEQDDGTLYGDGVNIAARLESLAEPGHVCVSESAHMQVRNKLDVGFEDIGEHEVKNIAEPVRAYRVLTDGSAGTATPSASSVPGRRIALIAAAAVTVLVVAGVAVWHTSKPPPAPPSMVRTEPHDQVLALPTGPSIAVLPFDNLSGDPGQDYFSDGLTDDIITALSRFQNVFVFAQGATLKYKNQDVDLDVIGNELGARYVLHGSVRNVGDKVRVNARLNDVGSGAQLWAETYDRDLTADDVFAVQDDIKEKVVSVVAGDFGIITRAGIATTEGKPTENLDAYECVLQAKLFRGVRHTREEHARAMVCIERAVALDPDYVAARAWRAYLYSEEFVHKWSDSVAPEDALAIAFADARRAVEMDPTNQMAHSQLAYAFFYGEEYEAFLPEAERAIELNPNNSLTLAGLGSMIRVAGQSERGVALVKKAIALNPNHPGWYHIALFGDHYEKGEYESALAEALKINTPGFWANHSALAQVYGQLGRSDEARAAAATLLELNPTFREKARDELRKFFHAAAHIEHAIDGLRKAGLDIPDEPPAGD